MRVFLSTLLICCILPPAAGFAQSASQGTPTRLPLVAVEPVTLENAAKPEQYVGHVESIISVDLRARVEGYLEEVNFQEGAFVKKGQLLYIIEQRPYRARLASAEAKVIQAKANLSKADFRLRRLSTAQPESVPQTTLDDARADSELAQGQLEEARANLELAQINLDYTTVKAPLDGRIGKSFYKTGDLVSPASGPLGELVSVDPIRVLFSVSEKQVDMIQKAFHDSRNPEKKDALKVQLEFPDKKPYPRSGRIEFVDNKIDPDTGTIAVWARFDNPEGRLVPGEYVNVFVGSQKPDMKPAVLQRALMADRDGDFVYVVNESNTVKKRPIQTGPAINNRFVVKSGLRKDERVIVEGLQKVQPEMKVQVRDNQQTGSNQQHRNKAK